MTVDGALGVLIARFYVSPSVSFFPLRILSHDFPIRFHGTLHNIDVAQFTSLAARILSRISADFDARSRGFFDESAAHADLSAQSRVIEFATLAAAVAVTATRERETGSLSFLSFFRR